MEHLQFGSFVAQLRKEQNMTQKELADKLNVTDKAVSKWETGKGFPDVKLLEPLAQVLGVSLVELMQGQRQQVETLTMVQAETVMVQAMDQSVKTTARHYLRLFRWLLTAVAVGCFLHLYPYIFVFIHSIYFHTVIMNRPGVIGGADGPTAIITAPITPPPMWMLVGVPAAILAVSLFLAIKVRAAEKKLKK